MNKVRAARHLHLAICAAINVTQLRIGAKKLRSASTRRRRRYWYNVLNRNAALASQELKQMGCIG